MMQEKKKDGLLTEKKSQLCFLNEFFDLEKDKKAIVQIIVQIQKNTVAPKLDSALH